MSDLDVAIIGAGAAGVAAGRRLKAAGVSARLFEARSRLGGRGFTVEDAVAGPLDLGCEWLHSGDRNPWVGIAEAQGREVVRGETPWRRPALEGAMSLADQEAFNEANDAFHTRLAEGVSGGGPDLAAGAYLAQGCRWNGLIGAVSTYVSGSALDTVSARDLDAYADSGVNWRLAAGYGALIAGHGAGLDVAFDAPVRLVDHSGRLVRVETARGTIEARAVIVTAPSALIASGVVRFVPDLAEKTAAAGGLPLGLADKLFFLLDAADEFADDARAFGRTDRVDTAAYHIRPLGRPIIEAYFGGPLAGELERGGETAFEAFARDELAGLFGSDFCRRLTARPMHLWAQDPYARGSYSYALPGRAGDRARLADPVDGRLFFAGEACSTHDYSTAHGAYRTGIAAAEAAIAALMSRP